MAVEGILWHILEGISLVAVFIAQCVILSLFTVYSKTEFPNNYVDPIYQKIFWLVGDLICLLGFALAWLCGFEYLGFGKTRGVNQADMNQDNVDEVIETISQESGAHARAGLPSKPLILGFVTSEKLPLTYISWFFYATLLILKLALICSAWRERYDDIKLGDDGEVMDIFEPETLLVGIGLSGVIFSLLVDANHNAREDDIKRNHYLNYIAYGVALEILDTSSLLTFLLPSTETIAQAKAAGTPLEPYSAFITGTIIVLSAINLLLPCITLYKLTTNKFGVIYHIKIELIYNSLRFLFVSLPFVIMRIYLWTIHGHKDILFLIKNLYMIRDYFRGTFYDLLHWKDSKKRTMSTSTYVESRRGSESVSGE